jgi:hypothetical protein
MTPPKNVKMLYKNPHENKANSTYSGSLTNFEFFLGKINGQSRKMRYLF